MNWNLPVVSQRVRETIIVIRDDKRFRYALLFSVLVMVLSYNGCQFDFSMGKISMGKVYEVNTTEYIPVIDSSTDDNSNITNTSNKSTVTKSFSSMNQDERHAAILEYIETHKELAIAEMKQFKIPASIKLAQGILESGAGTSTLTKRDNNHFGVKCRTKCDDCLCRNYLTKEHRNGVTRDEYHFFMSYQSAWWSYREHSKLLTNERYKSCFKCKDYECFAHNLQKNGYATDPNYAKSLINIIQRYKLYQYDQVTSFHS